MNRERKNIQVQLQRTNLLSTEREITRREKRREGSGEEIVVRRRETPLSSRDIPGNRIERRGSQYGGWRGHARDKMATSEKLAEENHGDRSRRARARAHSHADRIPRVHASRLDNSTLKSQTAANSHGKFAYHFRYRKRRRRCGSRRRNVSYLSKTLAISWNRPPRHVARNISR